MGLELGITEGTELGAVLGGADGPSLGDVVGMVEGATEEEADVLFRYLDEDGDGLLSFDDFLPWYRDAADAATATAMRKGSGDTPNVPAI